MGSEMCIRDSFNSAKTPKKSANILDAEGKILGVKRKYRHDQEGVLEED